MNAPPSRRRFLQASTASWAALAAFARQSFADDRPAVVDPRATDGDTRFEPDWEERLTLTVGPQGADLNGRDDRVLQAAVDYVARLGGGTVKVLPGEYLLRAAVHLPSNIRLLGSGPDAVLTRGPSETIPLAADSDWYDQEITLAQPGGFRVGDSVALQANNPSTQAAIVIKRRIVAKSGNRLKLDDGLRENVWLAGQPSCSSLFPLLTSEYTADVTIENLTLDGNGSQTENFNGNYGGCIFLQDCNRYTLRGVETRNYNGDGISFQICHDVVVDKCYSHGNTDLGVHPGSGSQRPLIRNCRLEGNGLGLFWCWGVKYGLAEGNRIVDNRNYGISIGHNDTDNVMRDNDVIGSGKVGILFRDDSRGQDFWANRNLIENNRIVNSGGPTGIAIDIQGRTKDVTIRGNEIRESRGSMERVGIRIAAEAQRIALSDNRLQGLAKDLVDHRS
ncbi:MAG: right-handed parallel beta-helix repeat-containing protein [Planctomycetales bacterium]|nr:right-handed parallel beta-helix repeat-containing protein [Planctomycetales bacterium]